LIAEGPGGRTSGRIVETEAYLPADPSSHAYRGMTARNGSMFLHRGHAYVYLSHGTAWCINVASEREGIGAGVLLRALEPVEGIALMQRRRGVAPAAMPLRLLTAGPGRLAQALGVDRRFDGVDLCSDSSLWLAAARGNAAKAEVGVSTRIGISRAQDRLLRFYERGNRFVSGPRRLSP